MSEAKNPNADYDTLLDTQKSVFPDIYEKAMNHLASEYELSTELQELLSKKRAFGLEKYGARAFQSSIENAVASPVAAHLGDEIIDAFNYALHGYYIANMQFREREAQSFSRVIDSLVTLVASLSDLQSSLEDEKQKEALSWTRL